MRKNYIIYLSALVLTIFSHSALAEKKSDNIDKNQQIQQEALETLKGISMGVQALKDDVVTLNKDLRLMEEKLLFPSSTKYSVFVSMSSGLFFTLESVKLKLDGRLVATHLYSQKQRDALARGGIHKLYITNLNQGKHTATAFFTGLGPNGRAYKLAKTLDFEKSDAGEYLELAIRDDGQAQEPVVFIKQW